MRPDDCCPYRFLLSLLYAGQKLFRELDIVLGSVAALVIVHYISVLQRGFCQSDILADLGVEDLVAQGRTQLLFNAFRQFAAFPSGDEYAADLHQRIELALYHIDEIGNHGQSLEGQDL